MNRKILFFPRNPQHTAFFTKVAEVLKDKGQQSLFLKESGLVTGFDSFEFEAELNKIWGTLDDVEETIASLKKKYPGFNFLRAVLSERDFNHFPMYYGLSPVSREKQLKYLIGCFLIFENWLNKEKVKFVVCEFTLGLSDAILKEVSKAKGIPYYSFRQSKMTPGIVVGLSYHDEPMGMRANYENFLNNKIPEKILNLAQLHIREVREKIEHPSYMINTKKPIKLFDLKKIKLLWSRAFSERVPVYPVSRTQYPIIRSIYWFLYKYYNALKIKLFPSKYFYQGDLNTVKYFIYPLHYEPEASVTVRGYYFSDQLATIKLVSRLLPVDVCLVVKEHGGNQGYRKTSFYRELKYIPNVLVLHSSYDVSGLLKNALGVMTLSGRMGWEAIINRKPVLAFGQCFWSWHKSVYNVDSINGLKEKINELTGYDYIHPYDENELIAFASSYINCIFEGSFVISTDFFHSKENLDKFSDMLISLK